MVRHLIRNVLIGAVWSGTLTALALGAYPVGLGLGALGVVLLMLASRGRTGLMFGASSKPTTTDTE